MSALDVFCRTCGAVPGAVCRTEQHRLVVTTPHKTRRDDAEETSRDD